MTRVKPSAVFLLVAVAACSVALWWYSFWPPAGWSLPRSISKDRRLRKRQPLLYAA